MSVDVIVGLQRGDEGKGRFVDMLAGEYDIVARFNGGNNAGHTVVLPNGQSLKLHSVPSGIAYPHVVNVIGSGTLIDPVKLLVEFAHIQSEGIKITPDNLQISSCAHLILPHHICQDELREAGNARQGSTKSGIAQVASDKALRTGVRAEIIGSDPSRLESLVQEGLAALRQARKSAGLPDLDEAAVASNFAQKAQKLAPYIKDTALYLNEQLSKSTPARVLAEGAQAFLLDIDYGMYPFTSSSSTTSGGVASGLGIPPTFVENIIGVAKVIQSHVGDGPFVTEITDSKLLKRLYGDMMTIDAERGTTTGRVRRLGYLDLPQIRRANMINGTQSMALSKLDWLSRFGKEIPVCVAYKSSGRLIDIAPGSAQELAGCIPVYKNLAGWTEDIQHIRTSDDLPAHAKAYVKFVEDQTGVPASMIGVGPGRGQVIVRSAATSAL
jgi:adenylosuccinate synthase